MSCVQEQLIALSYDPGVVDGQFGRRTAAAFDKLLEASPEAAAAGTSSLSAVNAGDWCEALGRAFPEAATIQRKYATAIAEELGGFRYDIAPDVPGASVAEIREGLALARSFISRTFGSEIPADVRAGITVKIVATGRGNEERWGGGAPATALSAGKPRPFFDVAHPQWSQNTRGRGWTTRTDNLKTVIHEYTHAWQAVLGALTLHRQELGNWMNEGLAEYVAYRAIEEAGLADWDDITSFMARASRGPELDHPLRDFGSTRTPAWAGHVGFLAIDWLVADSSAGIAAIEQLAAEVAAGSSQKQAFANVFGLSLDDFYRQFEVWRQALRDNPVRAYARRPALEFPAASTVAAAAEDAEASVPSAGQAEAWFQAALALRGGDADELREAARLYGLATEAGHAAAARNLAGMYGSGRGVRKDDKEAGRLFRLAAEAGDAQGQYALATWYLGRSATEEKVSWLRKAAAQGHREAIAALGDMGVPLTAEASDAVLERNCMRENCATAADARQGTVVNVQAAFRGSHRQHAHTFLVIAVGADNKALWWEEQTAEGDRFEVAVPRNIGYAAVERIDVMLAGPADEFEAASRSVATTLDDGAPGTLEIVVDVGNLD